MRPACELLVDAGMLRPAVALALTLAASAGGCTKTGMIAAGGAIALTGVAVAATPNEMETEHGFFGGTYQSEDHSNDVLGGLLAITGAVMLLAGASMRDDEERRMVTVYPAPVPMPVYAVAPVYPESPPVVVDAPNAETVIIADTVVVEHAPAGAAIASQMSNRLAIQASVTARKGECAAAVLTAKKLAEIDIELYERLLVTDVAVAECSVTTR